MSKATSSLAVPSSAAWEGRPCWGSRLGRERPPEPRLSAAEKGAETELVLLPISFIPEIARPLSGLQSARWSCHVLICPRSSLRERACPEPLQAGMRITPLIPRSAKHSPLARLAEFRKSKYFFGDSSKWFCFLNTCRPGVWKEEI